jgi:spermidine synthase
MDPIIQHIDTWLQKVVIEKWEDDLRLTLDGDLQFSFKEDMIYTNAMSLTPMRYINPEKKISVLILGWGDGFIADKIRSFPHVVHIDLCEIDRGMIELCRTDNDIRHFNHDVFLDQRLHIHIEDAYEWIWDQSKTYDLIIADFPDAHAIELSKLYSKEFFNNIHKLLDPQWVFITIASEIHYTQSCFESIIKTVNSIFNYSVPFFLHMPETYGDIWLIMASKSDLFHMHLDSINLYIPQFQDTIEINTIENNIAYHVFHRETIASGFIPWITNKPISKNAN